MCFLEEEAFDHHSLQHHLSDDSNTTSSLPHLPNSTRVNPTNRNNGNSIPVHNNNSPQQPLHIASASPQSAGRAITSLQAIKQSLTQLDPEPVWQGVITRALLVYTDARYYYSLLICKQLQLIQLITLLYFPLCLSLSHIYIYIYI